MSQSNPSIPKMSVEEIQSRFDHEVERFSNLETGQVAITDARLMLDLVTEAAARVTPGAVDLCDIGCGAGNYTLKMLQHLPRLNVTMVDLSRPMLDRAAMRVGEQLVGTLQQFQGDMRTVDLGTEQFDIVLAAATLHHLRTDADWQQMFQKIFAALRPKGSFWICDIIEQDHPALQEMMWQRWGAYLQQLKGPEYRETVYDYVLREDTPKSLEYQLDLMKSVGFESVHVLHKIDVFAAFGAIKAGC